MSKYNLTKDEVWKILDLPGVKLMARTLPIGKVVTGHVIAKDWALEEGSLDCEDDTGQYLFKWKYVMKYKEKGKDWVKFMYQRQKNLFDG